MVVTGGAGALGMAVVDRLARAGAEVHVPCFEAEVPPSLVDRPGVHATPAVDMADEAAASAYYESLKELWASVQLAGGFGMGGIAQTTFAQLEKLLSLNVATCFNACRAATLAIRRTGEGGRIVNVAAKPVLEASAGVNMAAYAASKSAVAGLTRALGHELAPEGIFVNAIAPSIIDTPANRAAMPDADFDAWPKVEELAEVIAALCAPGNAVVRGAIVPVYGRS